jgi:hypothetical protein
MMQDRWGTARDWEYTGDVNIEIGGGRWFDLAGAADFNEKRPITSDNDDNVLRWVTCGVTNVDVVRVDPIDEIDGAVTIENGSVFLPFRMEDLLKILNFVGTSIEELPEEARERLLLVADAQQAYWGIDLSTSLRLQTKIDETATAGQNIHERLNEGVDVQEYLKADWLGLGEAMHDPYVSGVLVCEEFITPGYLDEVPIRFALDRKLADFIALEKRTEEGEWVEVPRKDSDFRAFRDEVLGELGSETLSSATVVPEFNGFADNAHQMKF